MMIQRMIYMTILALAAFTANAQNDFDPVLPGEPNAQYKVTVGISHAGAGTVNGGGSFVAGTKVNIRRNDVNVSSSSKVFYKFKYWTLDGEEYAPAGKQTSFQYTVGTQNAVFQAVYEEEDPDNVTSKVFLIADPADACTFNVNSGQRFLEDNSVYLYYNKTSDAFKFEGWYEGNNLITTDRYFNYNLGKDDATLVAKFSYEPTIPGEPINNGQTDVDNSMKGDVNNDNVVDIQDVVACMNVVLAGSDNERADVNKDSQIDIQDVVSIVNLILNQE